MEKAIHTFAAPFAMCIFRGLFEKCFGLLVNVCSLSNHSPGYKSTLLSADVKLAARFLLVNIAVGPQSEASRPVLYVNILKYVVAAE